MKSRPETTPGCKAQRIRAGLLIKLYSDEVLAVQIPSWLPGEMIDTLKPPYSLPELLQRNSLLPPLLTEALSLLTVKTDPCVSR